MKRFSAPLVLLYLKYLAKIAIFIHKPITIGVAGSVGKSSTRNAVFSILKSQGRTRMVYGNSETGVPLGILGFRIHDFSLLGWLKMLILCPFQIFSLKNFKYLIVEMGIDDPFPPKNMGYLLSIVRPDIAVDLNSSATHTMQFEKLLNYKSKEKDNLEFLLEKIAEEDSRIIRESNCRVGIYNADDKYVSSALGSFGGKLIAFGKNSRDIIYGKYSVDMERTVFEFRINSENIKITIESQVLPEAYQELFAATVLVGREVGIQPKVAARSLERNFVLPKGRGSILQGVKNSIIIDSSYNSSANAVIPYLVLLKTLKEQTKRPAAFLMGDMRELGKEARGEHIRVARKINEVADVVYCVGPQTKEFVIPNINPPIKTFWFDNSRSAGRFISQNIVPNSLLLVKGSQNEIFLEEAIGKLLKNPEHVDKLCRQDDYFKKIKRDFFANNSHKSTAEEEQLHA